MGWWWILLCAPLRSFSVSHSDRCWLYWLGWGVLFCGYKIINNSILQWCQILYEKSKSTIMIHDSTRKIHLFVMKCCCTDPTFPFVLWLAGTVDKDMDISSSWSQRRQAAARLLYLYIFGACLATIVVIVPGTARAIELSTNLREVTQWPSPFWSTY